MSARLDFYFRMKVTEADLDLAFAQLEQADRDLAADLGIVGLIRGAVAVPHAPVADLTIDLTAPGRGYDRLGRRLFLAANQRVDCAVDLTGTPTVVVAPQAERWLSVFLRFARLLSEPRTDGNNQTVYLRRDEAVEVVVRQGPAAATGQATRPNLEPDELLLCDVRRTVGQTQIVATDLDTSRREVFVFAAADAVSTVSGGWRALATNAHTVQAALDSADQVIADHVAGVATRHHAADIELVPHGFLGAGTVQAGFDQLLDSLQSATAGAPGAARVGADAVPGNPVALAAGTVDLQLSQLAAVANAHITGAPAHNATQISATAHAFIAATTVQGQLQEIVSDLALTTLGQSGAAKIGAEAQLIVNAPGSLTAGTVRDQLGQLLSLINLHLLATAGAHPAAAVTLADAADRFAASTVEQALAEAMLTLSTGHFRGNEPNAGFHRAIRQPALGAGRVLIWESFGNGTAGARFRVYADDTGVWLVLGVFWDGTVWQWDAPNGRAFALHLAGDVFEIYQSSYTPPNSTGFTTWARVWTLLADTGEAGLVATRPGMNQICRLSLEGLVGSNGQVRMGTSVTFAPRFDQPPSSVTLQVLSQLNWAPSVAVQVTDLDAFGFATTATHTNLTAGLPVRWVGRAIVVR
jgi:hypothetical protein